MKELALQVQMQRSDLVQEERAAFRLGQFSFFTCDSARKRATLVAEQLPLQKRFAEGRAVDPHKRPSRPRPVIVQRAGGQLFPGALLAHNEHRGIEHRHLADEFQYMPDGRSFSHNRELRQPAVASLIACVAQQENEYRNADGNLVAMEQHSLLDRNAVYESAILAVVIGDTKAFACKFDGAMMARHARIRLRKIVLGFAADGEAFGQNRVAGAL